MVRGNKEKSVKDEIKYLDIFTGVNDRGRKAQFIKIRYNNKIYDKELSSRIYEGIDASRIPYFLLDNTVIYLGDVKF